MWHAAIPNGNLAWAGFLSRHLSRLRDLHGHLSSLALSGLAALAAWWRLCQERKLVDTLLHDEGAVCSSWVVVNVCVAVGLAPSPADMSTYYAQPSIRPLAPVYVRHMTLHLPVGLPQQLCDTNKAQLALLCAAATLFFRPAGAGCGCWYGRHGLGKGVCV